MTVTPIALTSDIGQAQPSVPQRMGRPTVLDRQFSRNIARFRMWGFDRKGWSARTRHLYCLHATAAHSWLVTERDVSLFKACQKDLIAYLSSTAPHPESRNNILSALRGYSAFLVDTGQRKDDPTVGIERLRRRQSVPKAFDSHTASMILSAANVRGPREHAVLSVMLYTGARAAETIQLQWSAVESDEWLRIHGKGNKERLVPLHRQALDALKTWRKSSHRSAWVFPSGWNPSRPMSGTGMRAMVSQVGKDAGVPGLHPHLCRHSYASRLIELGVDIRIVQELLGHASVATTQIYTKVRPMQLRQAVEMLSFG